MGSDEEMSGEEMGGEVLGGEDLGRDDLGRGLTDGGRLNRAGRKDPPPGIVPPQFAERAASWKKGEVPKERIKSDGTLASAKGKLSLKKTMRRILGRLDPKDPQQRTYGELVVLATIAHAIKGHGTAMRLVWEYMEGKVPSNIDLTKFHTAVEREIDFDDEEANELARGLLRRIGSRLAHSEAGISEEDARGLGLDNDIG